MQTTQSPKAGERTQHYAIKSIRTGQFYSTRTGKFSDEHTQSAAWDVILKEFIADKSIESVRQSGELFLAPVYQVA